MAVPRDKEARSLLRTPPKLPPTMMFQQNAETPGPTKARINHLQSQVSELVRKNQGLERKIQAEKSLHSTTVVEKTEEVNELKARLRAAQREVERCKVAENGVRDELQLQSMVQQQRALLALAQEQMQVVELEQRLVIAEKARIMRDHRISLLQAKEGDLLAELREKDAQISNLEHTLSKTSSSLTQLQSTSSLSSSTTSKELVSTQKELASSRSTIDNLENKVELLETKVKTLREREKEAKGELENWLKDEKSKNGSMEKSKKEFMNQIRMLKSDLSKKDEELEEFEEFRRSAKEREKTLKMRLKEANEERDRLVGVEEELQAMKSKGSPKKVNGKEKVRKASPVQDDSSDEEVAPKKRTKKAESPVRSTKTKPKSAPAPIPVPSPSSSESESETVVSKTKAAPKRAKSPAKSKKVPLETSDIDNQPPPKSKTSTISKKVVDVPAPEPEAESEPVTAAAAPKKKKRLLGGVKSAFEWDPIMGSGDGVIPLGLSPMKSITGKAAGTIPRAGFSAASRLNRLG
ncbi:hypothetical protein I302_101992 [Kwoniella bestiolae CBS 10118]|uniref:Uncharacterized protein n=1 Tax=Kwoniella bestiolae CBS 10118 TaxID=1296100 RepID=A0A1B9GDR3_9TREE|nr:hypothetical protein I302_00676 [Kwoniella bestiolae CBS 10118]OCF29180.1 hypothetical protein I302_00676 [Kwoniella bestiolae CBS 10118]